MMYAFLAARASTQSERGSHLERMYIHTVRTASPMVLLVVMRHERQSNISPSANGLGHY